MVVALVSVLRLGILIALTDLVLFLFEAVILVIHVVLFFTAILVCFPHLICLLHISEVIPILIFSLVCGRILELNLLNVKVYWSLAFYRSEILLKLYQVLRKLLRLFL